MNVHTNISSDFLFIWVILWVIDEKLCSAEMCPVFIINKSFQRQRERERERERERDKEKERNKQTMPEQCGASPLFSCTIRKAKCFPNLIKRLENHFRQEQRI